MPGIDLYETSIGPEDVIFGQEGNTLQCRWKLVRGLQVSLNHQCRGSWNFAIVTGWQVNKPLRISSATLR